MCFNDPIVAKHLARGDQFLTVRAGWGIADDAEVFRLVEATQSARSSLFITSNS